MRCDRTNFNPSYTGSRDEILSLVPEVKKVLDVGCSTGTLGKQIKQRDSKIEVVGIELNEQMAKIAKEKLDSVIVDDVEKVNLANYLAPNYFDCIVFADILEHLKNPWEILRSSVNFLNNEGIVIASIPNVRHYNTIISLLFKAYWPYRERGVHDKTHLRFFTLRNIQELFQYASLSIERIERNYRIIEKPSRINKLSKRFAIPFFKDLLTFQYLIVAKKKFGRES